MYLRRENETRSTVSIKFTVSETGQDSGGVPGSGSHSVSPISYLWEIGFSLHDLLRVLEGRFKELLIGMGGDAETRKLHQETTVQAWGRGPVLPQRIHMVPLNSFTELKLPTSGRC